MKIQVFIQNEAGSNYKNYHNEKTLEYLRTVVVSRAYPYPYGFIVGTTASDGYNADCFVITEQPLNTGETVTCDVAALLEQIEDGETDHNVLAVLPGDELNITDSLKSTLSDFVLHVFDHVPGKQIMVWDFLSAIQAERHVISCLDRTE